MVGVGARPDPDGDAIVAAVRTVLGDSPIRGLATIDRRAGAAGMVAAAAVLGVPVFGFDATELARIEVPNPAARTATSVGTGSVAEAAALLACRRWCERPRLLVPKSAFGAITVAVACC